MHDDDLSHSFETRISPFGRNDRCVMEQLGALGTEPVFARRLIFRGELHKVRIPYFVHWGLSCLPKSLAT